MMIREALEVMDRVRTLHGPCVGPCASLEPLKKKKPFFAPSCLI